MTDYMTISSMTVGCAPKRKYKVRAIREDGSHATLVGGWGTEVFTMDTEVFSNAEDVKDRLVPSVKAENENCTIFPKIVKLEAYYTKEHTVAEMDLEVRDNKVTTEITHWNYVPYSG